MLTYTLPAYIVYTTTFCLITQEVICPPLTHAAKYIQNNIYFLIKSALLLQGYFADFFLCLRVSIFVRHLLCWLFLFLRVSIFVRQLLCWLFLTSSGKDLHDSIVTITYTLLQVLLLQRCCRADEHTDKRSVGAEWWCCPWGEQSL